jgi:hypothetical protein
MKSITDLIGDRAVFWKQLFSITILSAYLYIFFEWLFFVTMPSFMSIMNIPARVEIYLISSLIFSILCVPLVIVVILLEIIGTLLRISHLTQYLGAFIPAAILSMIALLLIDNFTYSVFKFGIITSSGVGRGAYAVLLIALVVFFYLQLLKIIGIWDGPILTIRHINPFFTASVFLLAISTAIALVRLDYHNLMPVKSSNQEEPVYSLPNIILLGSDGLNAENLSAYGYYRNTTPQLAELAKTSLVAENAFTNAGNTTGSVISILTSKLPTQTRVLYPPNILTGLASYQHLPGILKSLGYKTVEYGMPYYVDAYSYNLLNGFDMVNGRTVNVGKIGTLGRKLGYEDEVYFLSRLSWRISERILHVFFIWTMQNPFDIVTQPAPNIDDADKIDQLLEMVDQTADPVFIHAHLLGTHGGYYDPPDHLFSGGKSQTREWMVDFYDDTLRAFDAYVGKVIYHLKKTGEFDHTILIIYTDHNQEFKVNQRIPLIVHFPGDMYAGEIISSVENLDIAPTILSYLEVPQPDWMQGESLLKQDLPDHRLIFSAGSTEMKPNENNVNFLDPALDKPPFYQFNYLNVIDCQKWYSLDLTTIGWSSGDVKGYVSPCEAEDLLTPDEIRQAMYDLLAKDGFDISSLP